MVLESNDMNDNLSNVFFYFLTFRFFKHFDSFKYLDSYQWIFETCKYSKYLIFETSSIEDMTLYVYLYAGMQ